MLKRSENVPGPGTSQEGRPQVGLNVTRWQHTQRSRQTPSLAPILKFLGSSLLVLVKLSLVDLSVKA